MNATALTDAAIGDRVRVDAISLDRSELQRLTALGITPGVEATIAQTTRSRTVLVARGARLALGRPVARQIRVTILKPT